jgi:hypothetical protein
MMTIEWIGLCIFAVLAVAPLAVPLCLLGRYLRLPGGPRRRRVLRCLLGASGAIFLLYAVVAVDAYWWEPNHPRLTRIDIEGNVPKPLRILHLTDLHLEPWETAGERWLKALLPTLNPDLILLTGDIHQLDNFDADRLRPVLSLLHAPIGVYACLGYDRASVIRAAAPGIKILENAGDVLAFGNERIGVCGLAHVGNRERGYQAILGSAYRIVLDHTPELAEEAARHRADLYLCGHTHGGQVRIPFWGAIITNSKTGKRYEAGLCRYRNTWVYTGCGLGLEPAPAPQVRFLCRPEVTLITVHPRKGR